MSFSEAVSLLASSSDCELSEGAVKFLWVAMLCVAIARSVHVSGILACLAQCLQTSDSR